MSERVCCECGGTLPEDEVVCIRAIESVEWGHRHAEDCIENLKPLRAALERVTREQDQLRLELANEESRADLHANINQAVSDALGQTVGASWHDLGEKVTALKRRAAAVVEKAK